MRNRMNQEGSTQTNVVTQIRQYHGQVLSLNKSIADIGKEQIRAAYKCGQLLARQRMKCPSNGWGKWCKKNLPDISKSTIWRYISLTEVSDLTHLLRNYRTLNMAYVGEGITSAPRQRITIKTINGSSAKTGHGQVLEHHNADGTASAGSEPTSKHHNGNGNASTGCEPTLKHHNGDGNDGINLKAKVKGGGNLGDLMSKVSPSARAEIESQLEKTATGDGKAQTSTYRTVAPNAALDIGADADTPYRENAPASFSAKEIAAMYPGPVLAGALMIHLNSHTSSKGAKEIEEWVAVLKRIIKSYHQDAPKAGVALAA